MTLFPWLLGEAPWSLIYNAPKVSLDVFKTRKKLLASVGVKSLQRLSWLSSERSKTFFPRWPPPQEAVTRGEVSSSLSF